MIRQAKTSESGLLSNFTVTSKAFWGYDEEFLEKCRPHLIVSEEYIAKWPVRVLEIEDEILGYYSLKVINGENRLDNLWISPKYIRQGHGSTLFNDSVKTARKLNWDFLRIATDKYAVNFYEKLGFINIGKVQSRLGGDIFLIHMEYKIK
jgi:N-acetylglutamate synthase-like GNAT family acetyltransferase